MDKTTETDLVQRLKNDDPRSVSRAHHHTLQSFYIAPFIQKLRNVETAQDLTQDAFVKIWNRRKILRPKQSFFAILAKIGVNLAQDELRKRQVRTKYQDRVKDLAEKMVATPHDDLEESQLKRKMEQVIANDLPSRCRLVFVLSRIEGYSNGEVADLLGISKKTVENQLHKALKIFRKQCGFKI